MPLNSEEKRFPTSQQSHNNETPIKCDLCKIMKKKLEVYVNPICGHGLCQQCVEKQSFLNIINP